MIGVDELLEKHGANVIVPFQAAQPASARDIDTPCGVGSVLSSADFVDGFVPPDYVIDGVIQRHRVYSNTGVTGCGKTAILLRLLASVSMGCNVGGRGTEKGRCLMLVGENPDDVRARWIALSEQMGFFTNEIDVYFMPGVFPVSELLPLLQQKAEELGGLSLIGVDTGAAFFDGTDENDNKQMGDYARRLRRLSDLPGQPCTLVNCHPVKNASDDNLAPRGGGAFLAEMDGNLASKRKGDNGVELHWQHKFRGPDFTPLTFGLLTVVSPKLVDSKGRPLPTVYAKPLTQIELANSEAQTSTDKKTLIAVMAANPGASISELALQAGWASSGGEPAKSKVHRLIKGLAADKLAAKQVGTWALTPAGEKAAKRFATMAAP